MKRHFPYSEKDESIGSKKRNLDDPGIRRVSLLQCSYGFIAEFCDLLDCWE